MTKKENVFQAGTVIDIGYKILEEFKKAYPKEYEEMIKDEDELR